MESLGLPAFGQTPRAAAALLISELRRIDPGYPGLVVEALASAGQMREAAALAEVGLDHRLGEAIASLAGVWSEVKTAQSSPSAGVPIADASKIRLRFSGIRPAAATPAVSTYKLIRTLKASLRPISDHFIVAGQDLYPGEIVAPDGLLPAWVWHTFAHAADPPPFVFSEEPGFALSGCTVECHAEPSQVESLALCMLDRLGGLRETSKRESPKLCLDRWMREWAEALRSCDWPAQWPMYGPQ